VSEVWIEVVCSNGDRSEVPEDWEGAVAAARQMERDHFDACPCIGRGRDLTFAFFVDGKFSVTATAKGLDS